MSCDYLGGLGFQVPGDVINGRASVQNYALVRFDQFCARPANSFLLRQLVRVPRRKDELI